MRQATLDAPLAWSLPRTRVRGEDWLFGAGLTFSTASQLRPTSFPVGPGELALLAWGLLAVGGALVRDDLRLASYGRPFLRFWLVCLAVLTLDAIVANAAAQERLLSYRPLAAYAFVFLLLFAFVATRPAAHVIRSARPFTIVSTATLGVLFVAAHARVSLGPLEPWYSFRFRGWAENPNQIAFHLTPIPFLALYFAKRAEGTARKLGWWAVTGVSLAIGIATFSDALWFSWGAASVTFFALDYLFWRGRRSRSVAMGLLRWLILPLACIALLLGLGNMLYDGLAAETRTIYEEGNQGLERLLLWRHGLEAFAAAPVFGIGPGAHSGLAGPFQGAESHNSLIDWASNTGLVGLAGYLLLVGWLGVRLWRRRDPALIAMLVALQSVSFFHYTFRHPVFWFCLAFAGAASYVTGEEDAHVRVRGLH